MLYKQKVPLGRNSDALTNLANQLSKQKEYMLATATYVFSNWDRETMIETFRVLRVELNLTTVPRVSGYENTLTKQGKAILKSINIIRQSPPDFDCKDQVFGKLCIDSETLSKIVRRTNR